MSETTTSETANGTENEPYRGTVTTPTIVKLSGIAKTFYRGSEPIKVLDGLDLDVPNGSFEALMGPSGSGKSTLLNIIAGLDRPTSGTVLVAGADLTRMSDSQLARWRSQTIGFVFRRSRAHRRGGSRHRRRRPLHGLGRARLRNPVGRRAGATQGT